MVLSVYTDNPDWTQSLSFWKVYCKAEFGEQIIHFFIDLLYHIEAALPCQEFCPLVIKKKVHLQMQQNFQLRILEGKM